VLAIAETKRLRPACLASIYGDASAAASAAGRFDLAVREVRRVLDLRSRGASVRERAELTAALGKSLALAGRLDESVATERAALALLESESNANLDDDLALRFALGTALLRTGSYDESASTLQSIVKIAPSGLPAISALTLAASSLRSAGRDAEADASLDAALALARADADPNRKAFVLLWRARDRIRDERFADARRDLHEVVGDAIETNATATDLRAAAFGYLANVDLAEGRLADARSAAARSTAEYAKRPASVSALPESAMGEAYAALAIRLGYDTDARATIARLLPHAVRAFGDGNSIVAELRVLDGVAALGDRRYVQAEASFSRALHATLAVSRSGELGAIALLDRSIAKRFEGRFRAARTDLYAAHAMLGGAPNPRLVERLDVDRAILDDATHDDRDGAPAFAAALADVERDDASTRDDSERVVDAYLTFAIDRPRVAGLGAAAYDVALYRRWSSARSVAALRARVRRDDDPAILRDFDDRVAVASERAALDARANVADRAARVAVLARRSDALETSLATEAPDIAHELVTRAPRWSDVRAALRPGEAAVEIVRFRRIAARDATGVPWYLAVVIRADRPAPFVVELGAAAAIEGDALASYRRIGVAPAARSGPSDARALSRLVWEPIANAVVGVRTVYVAADGELGTIAFDALQNDDGSLVADRPGGRVVLVGATSDLGETPPTSQANAALVFGAPQFDASAADERAAIARVRTSPEPVADARARVPESRIVAAKLLAPDEATSPRPMLSPLPAAAADVRALVRALHAHRYDVRTFAGADAVEETFQAQSRGARIVHLATREAFLPDVDALALPAALPLFAAGRLVGAGSPAASDAPPLPDPSDAGPESDPMLRGLLFFAGADRAWSTRDAPPPDLESGVMTAREARTLDLRGADLVVLDTDAPDAGPARFGNAEIALRRAFRQAGARDVLTWLWRPPDLEASEMMDAFYARLLDGAEAREALRSAQREEREILRKRYGTSDPYYWAGAIVIGPLSPL
jgi:tetratricopeptide (TPR) repeat protein